MLVSEQVLESIAENEEFSRLLREDCELQLLKIC